MSNGAVKKRLVGGAQGGGWSSNFSINPFDTDVECANTSSNPSYDSANNHHVDRKRVRAPVQGCKVRVKAATKGMSLPRDTLRVNEHNGDFGAAFRSAVAAAARASDRRAFDAACNAYAQISAQPNTSANEAFVSALNDAPPGDVLRSVAAVVHERRWIDLGDRNQQTSAQTQAFAAPPNQQLRTGSAPAHTTFRRWKWEASSLAPSAVVPQLARRARAPHTLPPISVNSSNPGPPTAPAASSPLTRNFDDEAELRALLMCRPAARPAASAAAAALRALLPYMTGEEQQSMRARFASMTPLDALAAVLELARRLCALREPARVWGSPTVWSDDQLQVPGSLAAVWRRTQNDDVASQTSTEWPQPQSLFVSPSATTSPPEWANSSPAGLDPSAAPFAFHKLQLNDCSASPKPPPPGPPSSRF